MSSPPLQEPQSEFPSTRWSTVAAAADPNAFHARAALTELCSTYWYPIYAFIRRTGNDPEKSLDLTQSYFIRLLEKGVFAAADRRKGRFRAFLRTDCKHFLIDQNRQEHAEERGGRVGFVSIDARDAEGRYLYEPAESMTPERLFDRAWAVTLLNRVFDELADEYTRADKAELFAHLRVVLTDKTRAISAATLAERIGSTEGAVHVAVHRVKKRFRAVLQEQIAVTVGNARQIEDEMRDLLEAVRP